MGEKRALGQPPFSNLHKIKNIKFKNEKLKIQKGLRGRALFSHLILM
jgi:hypothetical protein